MTSPAATTTTSPRRSRPLGTCVTWPSTTRLAIVSVRVRRRAAACALPRPSAIAVAKLAKSTVNQSHAETAPTKKIGPPFTRPSMKATVVITLPTSTTNMTGLWATSRGSSFRNERPMAGQMSSRIETWRRLLRGSPRVVSGGMVC